MKKFHKYLVATFLSGATYCASLGQSDAMQVQTFDQMSDRDQLDYLLCLIGGTYSYLKAHGSPEKAEQVKSFFILPDGGHGLGVDTFFKNLEGARQVNQVNANNPNKKQLQVEHAFALTLKHEGIIVPLDDLFAAGETFHPSSPPGSSSGVTNSPAP